MGPDDRSPRNRSEVLVALASRHGFSCRKNEQNQWEITPQSPGQLSNQPTARVSDSLSSQQLSQFSWQLRQQGDRWLLLVNGTPQILLRVAEAIAFVNRQANIE